VNKDDEMGWTCSKHGRDENHTHFSRENLKGRDQLKELRVDGWIILKRILRKQGVRLWTEFMWPKISPTASFCEYNNKPSSSIKGGKSLETS
jgi:hypothetical protein